MTPPIERASTLAFAPAGSPREVLAAFLRLGLVSFGGPVAHLGYFHAEFVTRRRWLDARSFADLVALCQFLPGPASSQVGIALGLLRAGWCGALAAWAGFTLPSAIALVAFAYGIARYQGLASSAAVHGLAVAAVAIVAQAVWTMAKRLCPDRTRAGIAVFAALLTLLPLPSLTQLAAIAASGLLGWRLVDVARDEPSEPLALRVSRRAGLLAAGLFAALLLGLPALAAASGSPLLALIDGFYRAGALVFGGGHVVLPLLQSAVVPNGAVSNADFLAGYGAAQAVPGPLFSFAAYLGAVMHGPVSGWLGGALFLLVIYTPAFLLVVAALPFWDALRRQAAIRSTMAGINAGVVGILLSALYDPVWTTAIHARADFGLALAAFGLLAYARVSPVAVVLLSAAAGWLLSLL
jgi:chromate transporter